MNWSTPCVVTTYTHLSSKNFNPCSIRFLQLILVTSIFNLFSTVTQSTEFECFIKCGEFKTLGQLDRPILLKRGLNATYEEWIMSAEYIMASGNENVILCERGIRTFETYTRNTLDLQCIPVLRKKTHLPIIVDPSHAGGKWWLVEPMAKAAIAAGADGLMIEVHNNPEAALCDGAQSLKPEKYDALLKQVSQIATVIGKSL